MNDDRFIIQQQPVSCFPALPAAGINAQFAEFFIDLICHGPELRGAGTRCDHEIITQSGAVMHIQQFDILALLGVNAADNLSGQFQCCHSISSFPSAIFPAVNAIFPHDLQGIPCHGGGIGAHFLQCKFQ